MALKEAGLQEGFHQMGGESGEGVGATVTGRALFSQQWLWWLPTRKFRECHTNIKFLVC